METFFNCLLTTIVLSMAVALVSVGFHCYPLGVIAGAIAFVCLLVFCLILIWTD
jgi:hypothetical protein